MVGSSSHRRTGSRRDRVSPSGSGARENVKGTNDGACLDESSAGPEIPPGIPSENPRPGDSHAKDRATRASEEEEAIVHADVAEVLYRSPDERFALIRTREGDVAGGPLASTFPGERLRMRGYWRVHPRWGKRFEVEDYISAGPKSLDGLERFLASSAFPGMGRGLARRLVKALGDDLWAALDGDPEKLAMVGGIGEDRARALVEAWRALSSEREARLVLLESGLGPILTERVLHRGGVRTLTLLRRNPWTFVDSVRGLGFLRADAIARTLHLPTDSSPRAEAAVIHILKASADEGHACLPEDRLFDRADELGILPASLLRGLASLTEKDRIRLEKEVRPDEEPKRLVYLRSLHEAERSLATRIRALAAAHPAPLPFSHEAAAKLPARHMNITLAGEQIEALRQTLIHPVSIITGGPGTGKTTLVRAMVELARAASVPITLCAPTGRAAKRLQEATGAPASTIHRLLEVRAPDMRFLRHARRPLDASWFIVDEASMLDLPLASALVEAIPPGSRVVFMGDVDQLPSVGPGEVLADLLASHILPVARLEAVHRQGQASQIALNARRIRLGALPRAARNNEYGRHDFFMIEAKDDESAAQTIEDLMAERLPKRFRLDPRWDIQVLVPGHRGPVGVEALNHRLGRRLNPLENEDRRRIGFRTGDRVIQVRNNYDLELFNGDIGVVESLSGKSIRIRFDDRVVPLTPRELSDIEPAWAMTIHKAQGSEFPAVIIPLMLSHGVMLRRRLLYTALTRARRIAVIVAQSEALTRAVKEGGPDKRFGRLVDLLTDS